MRRGFWDCGRSWVLGPLVVRATCRSGCGPRESLASLPAVGGSSPRPVSCLAGPSSGACRLSAQPGLSGIQLETCVSGPQRKELPTTAADRVNGRPLAPETLPDLQVGLAQNFTKFCSCPGSRSVRFCACPVRVKPLITRTPHPARGSGDEAPPAFRARCPGGSSSWAGSSAGGQPPPSCERTSAVQFSRA